MNTNIFTYQSYISHSVGTRFKFAGGNLISTVPYNDVDFGSNTLSIYPTFAENSDKIYNCIYCGKTLLSESKVYHKVENAGIPQGSTSINKQRYGRRCESCNWWFIVNIYSEDDDLYDEDHVDMTTLEGTICKFPYITWEKLLKDAEQEINEYRSRLSDLSPAQVERLIAEILAQYHNCEVRLVGRSHDRGIDLILINGDETTAVQVKHRSERRKQRSESVVPVRGFVGAIVGEKFSKGIFYTTAVEYSTAAEKYAERVVRNVIPLSLYTVKEIRQFIGDILDRQWKTYAPLFQSDIEQT